MIFKMKNKFFILGGDLRNIELGKMLLEDGNKVIFYGIKDIENIEDTVNLEIAKNLKEGIEKSEIIVGPTPFSKDGEHINTPFFDEKIQIQELLKTKKNKIFIAGSLNENVKQKLEEKYLKVFDIMKQEELAILNTIATAEGTIEVAIKNTDEILQGAKVLVLGFGRVAKIVANKFSMLSCLVTCAARKQTDLAWINAYGYDSLDINNMVYDLKNFDIIINTVPQKILGMNELKHVSKDVLLIDLASSPGGIDGDVALNMGIKFVWALALPGKVAPKSSARFIKNTIYNILENMSKKVE